MKNHGFYVRYWIAAIGLAAAFGLGAVCLLVANSRPPTPVAAATTGPAGRASFEDGFSPVIQTILPAVVNIASSRIVRLPEGGLRSSPIPGSNSFSVEIFHASSESLVSNGNAAWAPASSSAAMAIFSRTTTSSKKPATFESFDRIIWNSKRA